MTANGWLQFVVFFAVLLLLMRPAGSLYRPRARRGKDLSRSAAPAHRTAHLSGLRHPRRPGNELAAIRRRDADLQLRLPAADLHHRTRPRLSALESAASGRRCPGYRLQYRGIVYHQHQLAGLHARNHHELFHPDGGLWPITTFSARPSASPSPLPWFAASRASNRPPSATSGSIPRAPSCGSCCPSAWWSRRC